MKVGDQIYTPRFCTVKIEEVFDTQEEAERAGYTEPTHYLNLEWKVAGKSIGENRMEFAAYRRERRNAERS